VILLFGGDGQLGREMVRVSAARAVPLAALSRAQADITDRAAVGNAIERHDPTLVVNAAGYTKVDLAETEADAAHRANAVGPGILAATCARAGVPLIHISTDYVFDGEKPGPYVEGDKIAPINVYGASKAAGEQAVRDAAPLHVIIRTSWIYGEFGQNFLKTMIQLAAKNDELRVVADQRGCPTSTPDLADAILAIAPQLLGAKGISGTYHFAGSGATTWHGFASRIVAAQAPLTGRAPRVTPITTAEFPRPARRPANSELDCSLIARVFGVRGRPWTEDADAITQAVVGANLARESHVA
jgi:dTDP-4-dehydrorhamnose reductase